MQAVKIIQISLIRSFKKNLQHTLIFAVGILASPSGFLHICSALKLVQINDITMFTTVFICRLIFTLTINSPTLYPPRKTGQFFPNQQIKTTLNSLCTIYHLIATEKLIYELTSAAMKEVHILREIALKCKNE